MDFTQSPASKPGSPARQLLREHTHHQHVRLNQHPLLRGITRPGYSLGMYKLVLAAYFHFYRAVEAAIDRSLATQSLNFSYDPRRKLQWIRDDLLHFGIDPEEDAFRPARPVCLPDIPDAGQLVGLLYTIEGSSMGGQVISGYLASNLGLNPEQGARFFHGYGDQIVSFWNQFEAFMDVTLTCDEAQSRANDSASSTFAMMEAILDEYATRHAH